MFYNSLNFKETVNNPFKYVSNYSVITDTPDLLYMRARYYVPSIGRFTQYDPIKGVNPYSYVGNNPIYWIDPSGNQAVIEYQMFATAIVVASIITLQYIWSNINRNYDKVAICMFAKGSPPNPNKTKEKIREPDGSTTEIERIRIQDGEKRIIRKRDPSGKTVEVRHEVEVGGEIVHSDNKEIK